MAQIVYGRINCCFGVEFLRRRGSVDGKAEKGATVALGPERRRRARLRQRRCSSRFDRHVCGQFSHHQGGRKLEESAPLRFVRRPLDLDRVKPARERHGQLLLVNLEFAPKFCRHHVGVALKRRLEPAKPSDRDTKRFVRRRQGVFIEPDIRHGGHTCGKAP